MRNDYKRSYMQFLIAFLGFVVISLFITFPVLENIRTQVIGRSNHPMFQGEIFFMQNMHSEITKGNLLHWFKTDNVNYPNGQNLGTRIAHSFHLYLVLPFTFLFDPILAYNLFVIFMLAFNGFSMYLLAREMFLKNIIAFACGVCFMINPYVLLKISMGSLHKTTLFLLPLYIICLFRLRENSNISNAVLSLIVLCFLNMSYPMYAYYAAIFTIILVIFDYTNKRNFYFAGNVLLMFMLFAAGNMLFEYILNFSKDYTAIFNFPKDDPPLFSNGTFDIIRPFWFFLSDPTGKPFGLSIIVTIMAIYAFIKNRKYARFFLAAALVFVVIASGPYIKDLNILGYKIYLPYYFIYKFTPLLYGEGLIFPIRALSVAFICFALLAGFALDSIPERRKLSAAIIFIILYSAELAIRFPELMPVNITSSGLPEIVEVSRRESFKGILNLPLSKDRVATNRYAYYAAMSNKKMMNSYDDDKISIYFPDKSDDQAKKLRFIKELSALDVRYIIIHLQFLDKNKINDIDWLKNYCIQSFEYQNDTLIVYRVPYLNEKVSIIHIPKDKHFIQAGIDYACDGDIILVAPGVYEENIDFKGKKILLKSTAGAEKTIIKGKGDTSVVFFGSGESNDSVVDGFTISNGSGSLLKGDSDETVRSNGGGICCFMSSPKIINNIIRNNKAENGGGICCVSSSPKISNNIIRNNSAVKGGGIRCSQESSPEINNNIIKDNSAKKLGGGIYWRVGSKPRIVNTKIISNVSDYQGGGIFGSAHTSDESIPPRKEKDTVYIEGCLIKGNKANTGSSICLGYSEYCIVIKNCIIEDERNSINDPCKVIIWEK